MPARRSVHAPLSTIASISDSSRKNINHGETVYDVPPRTPYRDCSRSAPAICRAVCERISPNRQAKKAVPILPLFQCEKVCNHVIIVIMALQAKWLISRPNRLFFRNRSNQASIVGFIPQNCPPSEKKMPCHTSKQPPSFAAPPRRRLKLAERRPVELHHISTHVGS